MAFQNSFGSQAKVVAAGARETTSRALLLLAATVSFVLSVSLWFAGHETNTSSGWPTETPPSL